MASIKVDSHNVLGKLSIIKSYLSVVQRSVSLGNLPTKQHIDTAYNANEELIKEIKEKAIKAKNIH